MLLMTGGGKKSGEQLLWYLCLYATEALILEFLLHKKDAGLWCIDTVLAEISAMTKIAIGSVN